MRSVRSLVVAVLASVVLVVPAVVLADGRVALVVGNSTYAHIGRLPNPDNDARDMSSALHRLGFEVTTELDADRVELTQALRRFTRQSAGADISLVFYAGHGIEMDGVNYLLPVDARLERDVDVRYETVTLDDLLVSTAGASLRLVILDACRNNPLARSMQRTSARRSVSDGSLGDLNEDLLGDETLVAYAAAAGTTAADGRGRNSPYTAALLAHLEQPLEIGLLFRRVRAQVLASTNGEQRSHEYHSLVEEHYLRGAPGPGQVTAVEGTSTGAQAQIEVVFWQSIATSDDPADFRAYLERFPTGTFASLARNRMAALFATAIDPPLDEQPVPQPATAPAVVLPSVSDLAAADSRVPGVFMLGDRQRLSRQCPRIPFVQNPHLANLIIFDDSDFTLEVRDARTGEEVFGVLGVGQENRFRPLCDAWDSIRDLISPGTVGPFPLDSPQTDPTVPSVLFFGFWIGDWQEFTRECSPVQPTRNFYDADLIVVNTDGNSVRMYDSDGNEVGRSSPFLRRNMFKDVCATVRSR